MCSRSMDSERSRWIDDAAQIATSGRWDAVNEQLKRMAANPGGPDNIWWVDLFLGLCSQVFSEYLLLKRAYQEGSARDASVLAWRARNLLELSVWAMYCARSRENARRLYEDAVRDVNGIFAAFIKWGEARAEKAEWFEPGRSAQQRISNQALSDGIAAVNGSFKHVRDAAEEVGIRDHFDLYNKILSKCAHPTAMQIMFSSQEALTTWQRDSFFSEGCLFFTGAFSALEEGIFLKTP